MVHGLRKKESKDKNKLNNLNETQTHTSLAHAQTMGSRRKSIFLFDENGDN
jgi:hypothetical protein